MHLREFLEKIIKVTSFNKYCIDCKKRKTSRALIWLGTFVCKHCALRHEQLPQNQQSTVYIKAVFKENWDDY